MHQVSWKQTGRSSYQFYGTSYNTPAFFVYQPGTNMHFSVAPYAHALSEIPAPSQTVAAPYAPVLKPLGTGGHGPGFDVAE
jgi:hypothetical protein